MPAFDREVKRYGIRWTMLPHESDSLIHSLEASGKWRRIYSDKVGVIDVRLPPPQPQTRAAVRQQP